MRDMDRTVEREVVSDADRAAAPVATPGSLRGDRPASAFVAREPRVGAPDARVADIRQRVREGVYDTRAVVERVARRILERGDL